MSLPLEKATYRAVAIATALDRSTQKNTKFIAVNFEIVEDEHYNGESPQAWKGYFTDRTTERTVESLQHMGYDGDNIEEFASLDRAGCAKLLPNVVEIVCEPEYFTGDDGNERGVLKVQWVNRIGGGRFKAANPLEGGELKAFAAEMKSVFRNARGPKASTGSRQTSAPYASNPNAASRAATAHPNAPSGAGGSNDDIPFGKVRW
jgi:hypothetical protein